MRDKTRSGEPFLTGFLARSYRSTWLGENPPVVKCVNEFIIDIANDYSTAPCLILMAVERYVMVCHSSIAKRVLTKRNRRIICIGLTVSVMILILCASIPTFVTNYDPEDCDKSFYADFITRYIFDGFILFATPAIICLVLYTLVGIRLWKVRQNASRNRNLTIAFLTTTMLWILLWSPRFSIVVYEALFDNDPGVLKFYEGNAHAGHVIPYYITQALTRPIKYTYSLLNPLIVMFTVRHFQTPLRSNKQATTIHGTANHN